MKRNILLAVLSVSALVFSAVLSLAQETPELPAPGASEAASSKPVVTEWLYGEVNSVDPAAGILTLTFLDYDTDIEKQAKVRVDSKTMFENVKSLEEIKVQDMVSIDYVVGADSRNLAVSISVEKPESLDDLDMESPEPPEPKHQLKPAIEDPAAPSAIDPGPAPARAQ